MTDEPLEAANKDKVASGDFELRARPRPVTRLNRKLLIGLTLTSLLIIYAATFYALRHSNLPQLGDKELYNVGNKERPEELTSLPESYDQVSQLGAPLPGELGKAVLDAERQVGLQPLPAAPSLLPFQSDPMQDRKRAERIRLAQRAQQGRESAVFFQLTQRTASIAGGANEALPLLQETAVEDDSSTIKLQSEQDPNHQGRKNAFLAQGPDKAIYNPHPLETPRSPYQLMAGTVIAASLITGLNSDLPGQVIAQVTEPVYDTATGRFLLIPQGSKLLGKYDSVVAYGQERALVIWQRLILPDGSSVLIDNLPATDRAGYAGLQDEVDFHTWRLIKGIALSTLLSVGTELAFDDDSDLIRALQQGSQNTITRAGKRITERNLNVQPTIKIRPGYPLRIIVHKDMVLRPFNEKQG